MAMDNGEGGGEIEEGKVRGRMKWGVGSGCVLVVFILASST